VTPEEWLDLARADAERRGLPEMIPVLQSLAEAMARLRAADPDGAEDTRAGGFAALSPRERR
jgi:hypothetical protein